MVSGTPTIERLRMSGPVDCVPPALNELSERGQALLRVLIEQYIEDGQPVGSRTLTFNPEARASVREPTG